MATTNFETELEALINRFSKENLSDTPDFILALYLQDCLEVFARTVKARDKWYGFAPWDGNTAVYEPKLSEEDTKNE